MKKTSLIGHCLELYEIILGGNAPADNTIQEFCRRRHYLGSKDRRFITDIVYGMIRNFRLLQATASGSFTLVHTSTPPHAVSSVALYATFAVKILGQAPSELQPDIEGIWNTHHRDIACGIFLETLSRRETETANTLDDVHRYSLMYSFPEEIVKEWIGRFGVAETAALCRALNEPALPVLRVNTLRATVDECQRALRSEDIMTRRTTLSPVGLVLEKRSNVQALRTFRQGFFEMQDEGSQLMSQLLDARSGQVVVDACAGGGGKTLHIAATMNNIGTLIAIDDNETRLTNARQRAGRAGASLVQFHVTGRDQARIDQWNGKADAVMVDAPCTGVGTFRRNPWLKMRWSENLAEQMSGLQRTVLETYAPFVKAGGRLLYATCSLLEKENEKVVEWFLSRYPEFSLVSAPEILAKQGIRLESNAPTLTLLPHQTGTDGFFAAVMMRK